MLSLFSLKSVGEGEGEEKEPVVAAEFASYSCRWISIMTFMTPS